MKILIVEDNDSDRKLLSLNMKHHGWDVIEATNGVEALEILKTERPDLIVSDILMPKMDGFELLWSIKQNQQTQDIPFIFYSAIYTGEKDKILALALGAEAFIEKPKEPNDLFETILNVYRSIEEVKLPDMRLIIEEEDFLKAYSHIVASKLDEKVRELTLLNKKYLELYGEYKTLLDSLPDSLCLLDESLTIQWVNRAFEQNTHLRSDDVVGRKCYQILMQEESACKDCIALKVFEGGKIETKELKTKNDRIWDIRAIPVTNQEGKTVRVIEIIRDITEQRKVQEQLINAQRLETVGLLAGGVAHDFKNLITPIIGFAHLIKLQVPSDSPVYSYAEKIYSAAENASALAQSLLALSRKQPLQMVAVDIDSLIQDFSVIVQKLIGNQVKLELKLNPGKHNVLCDVTQIKQVLTNLVTNARDAMPEGGKITIATKTFEIDEKFINSHGFGKPGKYVIISVSDTGVGIDESIRSRIFEPFFTTKSPDKGSGLGLAVVYGIVKQHSGFIDVYSKPNLGTTFKIYLPLIDSSEVEERVDDMSDSLFGNQELILVIEDDPSVRDYFRVVLKEANYRVVEAHTGVEGIQRYLENRDRVSLVILDLILPLKDGIEVLNEIRMINPNQRYLLVSGYPSEIVFEKGLLKGDVEFLCKPISPTVLLRKVKELVKS